MNIVFADLTHTGRVIHAIYFSLGIGYISAYTQKVLPDTKIHTFKYPDELATHLENNKPDIVAFSNYMWNEKLNRAFSIEVKKKYPSAIIVYGGPNFPTGSEEQRSYLAARPEIDFYVEGEGEVAFAGLCRTLAENAFNIDAIKSNRLQIPNARYIWDGALVSGALLDRIADIEADIPSPYLTGTLDKFFDGKLTAMLQTSRGCPYSCTYCHDGIAYMNKTRRFSQHRIEQELEYILRRTTAPTVMFADLNWGMFPEDLATARWLANSKKVNGWPQTVLGATAKNQKKRMLEMAEILGDSLTVGASVQSTDPEVLTNVKRFNISIESIVEMTMNARRSRSRTISEVILCLPGDSKVKHFKSLSDMMDAGIQNLNTFQFILLPGTEAANEASRKDFSYTTRFRVLPGCFGKYSIFGKEIPVAETHEVCIANSSMPLNDYLECRDYHLTLAIFNNGGLFDELLRLSEALGVSRPNAMERIHQIATSESSPVADLYRDFREDEARNFHVSQEAIDAFLAQDGILDGYLAGVYGNNQIFWFKAVATFQRFDHILDVASRATIELLREHGRLDEGTIEYIDDLKQVIAARKASLLEVDRTFKLSVAYDFDRIEADGYAVIPDSYRLPQRQTCVVGHTDHGRGVISQYYAQYGTALSSLSYFLHRDYMDVLYRKILSVE